MSYLTIKIKPLILVGSPGAGRTALTFRLLCSHPHKFEKVVSLTARSPRKNQINGINFYFTDNQTIQQMSKNGQLITKLMSPNGNYYALSRKQIENVIRHNKIPIIKLTLDAYNQNILKNNIDCNAIYIRTRNLIEVRNRLRVGMLEEEQINKKIINAEKDDKEVDKYFQEEDIIQNSKDLDDTYMRLKSRLFDLY